VKQSSGWYYWIAASAMPPRKDEAFRIATSATPPDGTTSQSTGKTTSHPTKQPQNGCQVVGYKPASWQVAGYRNDETFWIAASATPLPRSARSWSLVAITEIRNAVIANEVKQSSKTMMHFV
jgi:hypothetical protein